MLENQNLTTETVGTTITDFYVAEYKNSIVAVAGFEYYGSDALLRSDAVLPSFQRKRVGSRMVDWMITLTRQKGLKRIILLTNTAEIFFTKKGFRKIQHINQ